MYSVRPNLLMRRIYPSAVWRVPSKEKKIFLTFDDGPVPEVTPWVLSALRDYNAKATFFCVGANIEKHPEIFRQIIAEEHSIGNHTYNHLNGWKTKKEDYLKNIEKCNAQISRYADGQMKTHPHIFSFAHPNILFRPPYGRMTKSQISILKSQYSVVMWDVLSGDFDKKTSEEQCLQNVLTKAREGSIVVFHDSVKAKKNLYYVLPKFLKHFSEKGFVFKKLR